jgi:pheromone shutdown protein TraB
LYRVSSTDIATLVILDNSGCGFEDAVQRYLNNGDYERAEIERLEKLALANTTPQKTIPMAETIGLFVMLGIMVWFIAWKRKSK